MDPIVILLDTPQRREDMLRALARALNTWEAPPFWLRDLHNRLQNASCYPAQVTVARCRPAAVVHEAAPECLGVMLGARAEARHPQGTGLPWYVRVRRHFFG